MHSKSLLCATVLVALLVVPATGAVPQADELTVLIVDVGAGLCTVTRAPGPDGPHYMVYDAGSTAWQSQECFRAIDEVIEGDTIDLLIVSHPDTDHLSNADELLARFNVRHIIRTGHERPDIGNWVNFNQAVEAEARQGATVQNLRDQPLMPGTTIPVGDAVVSILVGWHDFPENMSASEARNVISIVARLEYAGRSVLFAGDTVGRGIGDPDTTCEAAEEIMVILHDAGEINLRSDVLIAPHHGADNGSSSCFIEAVFKDPDPTIPRYVIFSSGHVTNFAHPRTATAARYLNVSSLSMLRTDRGDDESNPTHWDDPNGIPGCEDARGDDSIEILIDSLGLLDVDYVTPGLGTCTNIATPTPSAAPSVAAGGGAPAAAGRAAAAVEPIPSGISLTVDLQAEEATITNSGAAERSLEGWALVSVTGGQRFILPAITLAAGQSVVITSGRDAAHVPPVSWRWSNANIWNNDGDVGELYDAAGQLVTRSTTVTTRATAAPAPQPKAKTQPPPVRTSTRRCGAICKDGSRSSATGRGACSRHGGVSRWVMCEMPPPLPWVPDTFGLCQR